MSSPDPTPDQDPPASASAVAGSSAAPAAPASFGPYKILKPLRTEGPVRWYRATHPEHGTVRLKVLEPEAKEDPAVLQRHVLEAQATRDVSHPGILKVLDSGALDGRHFLVTENVLERTLADAVAEFGAFPARRAVVLARRILDALEAAHAKGVVHRLLTPAMIYLTAEDHPKLFGFGRADQGEGLAGEDLATRVTRLTACAAPELVMRPAEATEAADVYSAGAVLFHMVTGEPAYQGEDASELAEAIVSWLPTVPSSIGSGLSRGLDLVILKALEKAPAHRFASAHYMERALALVEADETPEIRLHGRVRYREWPWSLRIILLTLFLQISYLVIFDRGPLLKIALTIRLWLR